MWRKKPWSSLSFLSSPLLSRHPRRSRGSTALRWKIDRPVAGVDIVGPNSSSSPKAGIHGAKGSATIRPVAGVAGVCMRETRTDERAACFDDSVRARNKEVRHMRSSQTPARDGQCSSDAPWIPGCAEDDDILLLRRDSQCSSDAPWIPGCAEDDDSLLSRVRALSPPGVLPHASRATGSLGSSLLSSVAGPRSSIAGPLMTLPYGSKREPWHGQSHVFSVLFQSTMQYRCVHTAEHSVMRPCGSRYTATLRIPRRITAPESLGISFRRLHVARGQPACVLLGDVQVFTGEAADRSQADPARIVDVGPRISLPQMRSVSRIPAITPCVIPLPESPVTM